MVRSSSLVSVFVLVGLTKYVVDILPPDTVLDSVHVAQQLPKSGEVIYYQMKPEVDKKLSLSIAPLQCPTGLLLALFPLQKNVSTHEAAALTSAILSLYFNPATNCMEKQNAAAEPKPHT